MSHNHTTSEKWWAWRKLLLQRQMWCEESQVQFLLLRWHLHSHTDCWFQIKFASCCRTNRLHKQYGAYQQNIMHSYRKAHATSTTPFCMDCKLWNADVIEVNMSTQVCSGVELHQPPPYWIGNDEELLTQVETHWLSRPTPKLAFNCTIPKLCFLRSNRWPAMSLKENYYISCTLGPWRNFAQNIVFRSR